MRNVLWGFITAISLIVSVEASGTRINETIIAVENSTISIKFGTEKLPGGEITSFYEIYRDGILLRKKPAIYELGLRYSQFDPLIDIPIVDPLLTSGEDTHLFIVQFFTQPLEEFQRDITRLGGAVRHFIAQNAYLVELNQDTCEKIEVLPYIRWIGAYHPAFRLEEYLLDNLEDAWSVYPVLRYNIQVHSADQKEVVAGRIADLGGIVENGDAGKLLVEATLNPDQLFQVARFDEVLFIDRWGPYGEDMNIAREIGGANYIETVAGYDGSGVNGEVFDNGFNLDHVDFQSRPLIEHGGAVGSSSHGAATSGICFGDGTGEFNARGMLPEGQGIVADYNMVGLTGANRYNHSGELLYPPFEAVFQTASVGSPRTSQYTTISAEADAYCFDFDLVHCQSHGNAGNTDARPQSWAKNIISGSGIYHNNTLDRSDDYWGYGASIGPATDGRIKPNFIHFYDNIWTTSTPSPVSYTTTFGGASGATAIIAGHVGLFFEMWSDGIFGNSVNPVGSVFENRSHAATARAMIIASSYQYDFAGPTHDLARLHQGWGMPDLQRLYDNRDKIYVIDESDILMPFEIATHTITVDPLEPELKIAMVYADPPGNPAMQTQHRVNDLTLKVISPDTELYWGNNGLYENPYSVPGGSADDKNTEECVFIEAPQAGQWTIEISADEIIQDSHLETAELDADYALVALGVAPSSLPDLAIDLTYQSGSPVPPGGGNLYFDVFAENQDNVALDFDAWLEVSYEGGAPTTVVQRSFTNYLPGWSINRPNTFFPVPASYAAGNYTLTGKVGNHPDVAWDESGFPFVKDGTVGIGGFQPFVPDVVPDPFVPITKPGSTTMPTEFALMGVYPNPFNPSTVISYQLPVASVVSLSVYDTGGRKVAELVDAWRNPGVHDLTFDASGLVSGVYLYRLEAGDFNASGKMVLMK
jgi:hypothetical protein